MNLGSPKVFFAPEMTGWPEGGNRAIPFAQILAFITVETLTGTTPAVLICGSEHVVCVFHPIRIYKWIAYLNVTSFHNRALESVLNS
jgi:hypothetical protein